MNPKDALRRLIHYSASRLFAVLGRTRTFFSSKARSLHRLKFFQGHFIVAVIDDRSTLARSASDEAGQQAEEGKRSFHQIILNDLESVFFEKKTDRDPM